MQQANISIRVDKSLKEKFCDLCEEFGLTTTSAIQIFMKAVVRERKIPFEIEAKSLTKIRKDGMKALEEMRQVVADRGYPEMTLDEINDFIAQVRNETSR
ncbi:MAG: type II toxin-antitoxin system RelB/DinJ family antitoxin [Muribaculaceae bacterium]|nr:type II toxin-antitoxin system RelB/DinJ family antitoxin [Muribaculaceae bacterium]